MNLKLIIRIAKSLLLARFKQTLVAAVGVTFSISMFIALLSFMAGLNDLLDDLLLLHFNLIMVIISVHSLLQKVYLLEWLNIFVQQ